MERGSGEFINPKSEYRNPKQSELNICKSEMLENGQPYDLEDRTFRFAKRTRAFVKTLPRTICHLEDAKQLVRSSGSVGANYIEANEALSKKDLIMRIKICRKEAKESIYWLRLLDPDSQEAERDLLVQEASEIMNIFGAILRNLEEGK